MKNQEKFLRGPLLVSVESGAPISMPGMMDTILNLGFNDEVARNLLPSVEMKTLYTLLMQDLYKCFKKLLEE